MIKEINNLLPITNISGMFVHSQRNWAALAKEAYTIMLSV